MYYVYMLRCTDNSIYTGITVDVNRRFEEHFQKGKTCAKYTFSHTAKKIEVVWETDNKSSASKLEYYIKKLTKEKKEKLILDKNLNNFLADKIDSSKYKIFSEIRGENTDENSIEVQK